jgi:hypothetical protein
VLETIFIAPLRTRPDETKKKTLKRRAGTPPTSVDVLHSF